MTLPVFLTFDLDWAPDFAIDRTAELLLGRGLRATWFVTHDSPAVDRLRGHPELFELGIHPNFLPGSTHGSTTKEVLRFCMGLVPAAVSVRTHALVQSTPLLAEIVTTTPVRVDASLLLPGVPHLCPFVQGYRGVPLLRMPTEWEDDMEMENGAPRWDAGAMLDYGGIRAIDFHPIHIWLNSREMGPYRELRDRGIPHQALREEDCVPYQNRGEGTRSTFEQLVAWIDPKRAQCLRELL
jgi:hypothetical protein